MSSKINHMKRSHRSERGKRAAFAAFKPQASRKHGIGGTAQAMGLLNFLLRRRTTKKISPTPGLPDLQSARTRVRKEIPIFASPS